MTESQQAVLLAFDEFVATRDMRLAAAFAEAHPELRTVDAVAALVLRVNATWNKDQNEAERIAGLAGILAGTNRLPTVGALYDLARFRNSLADGELDPHDHGAALRIAERFAAAETVAVLHPMLAVGALSYSSAVLAGVGQLSLNPPA